MSKPDVCIECGKPIEPGATAPLVGFNADGGMYRHSGACTEAATERDAYSTKCRGCPRYFDRRNGEPGRPLEYHSEKCRQAHARRVQQLWADAAKGRVPDTLDGIVSARNDLQALVADVRAGRYNTVAPGHAGKVLGTYSQKLAAAEAEIHKARRDEAVNRMATEGNRILRERQAAQDRELDEFVTGGIR